MNSSIYKNNLYDPRKLDRVNFSWTKIAKNFPGSSKTGNIHGTWFSITKRKCPVTWRLRQRGTRWNIGLLSVWTRENLGKSRADFAPAKKANRKGRETEAGSARRCIKLQWNANEWRKMKRGKEKLRFDFTMHRDRIGDFAPKSTAVSVSAGSANGCANRDAELPFRREMDQVSHFLSFLPFFPLAILSTISRK